MIYIIYIRCLYKMLCPPLVPFWSNRVWGLMVCRSIADFVLRCWPKDFIGLLSSIERHVNKLVFSICVWPRHFWADSFHEPLQTKLIALVDELSKPIQIWAENALLVHRGGLGNILFLLTLKLQRVVNFLRLHLPCRKAVQILPDSNSCGGA